MSNDEFITTKIFVEYYNKLVIEINKIIKRVEKLEKNIDTINSSTYNSQTSDSLQAKNTIAVMNIEDTPDETDKKFKLTKTKSGRKFKLDKKNSASLIKNKVDIKKINSNKNNNTEGNNSIAENIKNIYKKENNDLHYKIITEKKNTIFNNNSLTNLTDNMENNNQTRTIDYNEFSFKNILDLKKKQIQLKNQKSLTIASRNSKTANKEIKTPTKELKTQSSDIKKVKKNINNTINKSTMKLKSDIIKSEDEINLILSNIIQNFNKNMKNKESKFNLIYKATKNGDKVDIFHKLCDNQKNVIVVIETRGGCRFGGFTKRGFDSDEESKKDDSAFLFSFDKMKIYKIKKGCRAIACYSQSGPCFFGSKSDTIHIENNFLESSSHTDKKNVIYEKMEEDYELNRGEADFVVKELEIFKIGDE